MTERRLRPQRRRLLHHGHPLLEQPEADPLSSVASLFDVAMVFAVALLLAVFQVSRAHEWLMSENVTVVTNPGEDDMEIIRKEGVHIERLRMSDFDQGGAGTRLGLCYRLPNGDVVYVPDTQSDQEAPAAQQPVEGY